ncbi:hypothetical protein MMC22_008469 [Lobaria immixta]|nr:hypothetical protein [Lobaria immixta]
MSSRAFNHIDVSKGDNDEGQFGALLTDDAEPGTHLPFSFERLSDDGRTAFFRSPGSDELDQDRIFDSIDELSPDVLNDAYTIVQIRSFVHDIYIPDLKVDKTAEEISFDWLNLFSLFFAEEKTYGSIMQRWIDKTGAPTAPVMQALADPDSDNFGNMLAKQMDVFTTQEKAARKQARRSRVRRQSQDLTGEDVIFDEDYSQTEKSSLKEVQMAAFIAGFESFSDDDEDEPPSPGAKLCEWSFQWEQEQSP